MNRATNHEDREGERGRAETRWVVSPYLTAMPSDLWWFAYSKLANRSLRRALTAERASDRIIFDHLSAEFVRVSAEEYALLARLHEGPASAQYMTEADRPAVQRLSALGLLLDGDEAFRRHRYDHMGIEINSHCNFRCAFCPVSENPLPKQVMAPALIETVLDRVAEYGARSIHLNHYGEPTLSPHLLTSVRLARDRGLRVHLFTNASGLTAEKSRELADIGNVTVIVNLPSLDPEEFRRMTGSEQHAKVMRQVRAAVDCGLPVWLSINTASTMTLRQRRQLRRRLIAATGADAYVSRVISRAGSLEDSTYASAPVHEGRLAGCLSHLQMLIVSVDGDVLLCCNDYERDYVLGNLRESSLKEIVDGPRAIELRRWVFGAAEPPEDFICRRCEETRPRDDRLFIGSAAEGDPDDPRLGSLRKSLWARRLMARLPVRLGVDAVSDPQPGPPVLSMPGTRFR